MKKIAKISLVAAIAVAGLTTANAQQLEQAIKGVEVSGSVVYRYNDFNSDTSTTTADKTTGTGGATNQVNSGKDGTLATQDNNYKVGFNLSAPVNDFVKFNSRILVANDDGDFAGGAAGLETSTNGDLNPGVTLSNAYFGFTGFKNTTINAGKQGLTTPWTVATQIDGNEQTGTGALALHTLNSNVTLAGAYFNQTNLDKSTDAKVSDTALKGNLDGAADIATIGTIVALGPVTVDAWYADMQATFKTYTIGAKTSTTLGKLKLGADARFTALEFNRATAEFLNGYGALGDDTIDTSHNYTSNIHDDNSFAKLTITADYDIFNSKVVYGKTGNEGGLTALDNDASTTALGWGVNANGKADADYYHLQAGVNILPELNLSANYVNVDYTGSDTVTKDANNNVTDWTKKSVEEEEIYAQLTYKMSKNLVSYVRYGVYTKDTSEHVGKRENASDTVDLRGNTDSRVDAIDDTRGRIQIAYTF